MNYRFFSLFITSFLLSASLFGQLSVSKLFSDNAVLQRNIKVPIWGTAKPGSTVEIDLHNFNIALQVGKNGKWKFSMPAMEAGGPHTLTISSNTEKKVFKNILIGDVWLCSGQSNMEWTVQNSNNPAIEIANATDSNIRHFKVPLSNSFLPKDTLAGGNWEVCSPETAGNFSAVGYYFARELRKHQDVPVGLLNSSWGGSRIEPWMRAEVLGYKNAEEASDIVQEYMNSVEAKTIARLEKLIGKLPKEDLGMKEDFAFWASENYNHSSWKTMELPGHWESKGYPDLDGVVWYRKEIYLTKAETKTELQLSLGSIDDSEKTYLNGHLIGETKGYNVDRNYTIPAKHLNAGANIITIRVYDGGWGGGLNGACKKLYYESSKGKTSLCGEWHFNIGKVELNNAVMPNQMHTLLYNHMIHPILDFPIKGALWYQGESNAGIEDAQKYNKQFETMITDWRKLWNCGNFPFLWVQLANWQKEEEAPTDTGWARLREAQSQTLSVPNTAQAVIIDIGETDDIHPRNKQDVGLRLALGARKIAYNEDIVHAGPVYKSLEVKGNKIYLSFDLFGSSLKSKNGDTLQSFAIAGSDQKFYWAKAEIEGDKIVVHNADVSNPVAVRYAWENNPLKANLYNKEDIPASPFRTDDWAVK